MTSRSVTHTTFSIDRAFPVPPSQVFRAFADRERKQRWFAPPADWVGRHHSMEFRPGGRETNRGGPPGGPVHRFEARYHQIVDDERIVYSYDLFLDEQQMSVSLATIELRPADAGTAMTFTEQGAFFDGIDDPAGREEGTRLLLAALAESLVDLS